MEILQQLLEPQHDDHAGLCSPNLFIVYALIVLLITPLSDSQRHFVVFFFFFKCLIQPFKIYKAAIVHCEQTKHVV